LSHSLEGNSRQLYKYYKNINAHRLVTSTQLNKPPQMMEDCKLRQPSQEEILKVNNPEVSNIQVSEVAQMQDHQTQDLM